MKNGPSLESKETLSGDPFRSNPSTTKTPPPKPPVASLTAITMRGYFGIPIGALVYVSLWSMIPGLVMLPFAFSHPNVLWQFPLYVSLTITIALMASGLVALPAVALVCLFNASMGRPFYPATAIGIAGGLTAYICTMPILASFVYDQSLSGIVVSTLLVSLTSMLAGYLGAVRYLISDCKHLASDPVALAAYFPYQKHEFRYQFRLREMLALTGWVGAIFAVFGAVFRADPAGSFLILYYFPLQHLLFILFVPLQRRWIKERLWHSQLEKEESSPNASVVQVAIPDDQKTQCDPHDSE